MHALEINTLLIRSATLGSCHPSVGFPCDLLSRRRGQRCCRRPTGVIARHACSCCLCACWPSPLALPCVYLTGMRSCSRSRSAVAPPAAARMAQPPVEPLLAGSLAAHDGGWPRRRQAKELPYRAAAARLSSQACSGRASLESRSLASGTLVSELVHVGQDPPPHTHTLSSSLQRQHVRLAMPSMPGMLTARGWPARARCTAVRHRLGS